MTTLITGGTGLIGASLAAKLLARGERAVLFDVAPAEWRVRHLYHGAGDRLRVVRGDVTSLVDLLDAVRTHQARAIVHLAYVLGAESNARPEFATRVNIQRLRPRARGRAGRAAQVHTPRGRAAAPHRDRAGARGRRKRPVIVATAGPGQGSGPWSCSGWAAARISWRVSG